MRVEFSIANRLDEIVRVHSELTTLLEGSGCVQELIDEMCLIAEEVLVNIISHGFEPNTEAEIQFLFDDQQDHYALEFRDCGIAYNPLEADERPEGKVGGWGIPLVVELCEQVDYRFESEQNVLRLTVAKREK